MLVSLKFMLDHARSHGYGFLRVVVSNLEEVEAALKSHPAVFDALVVGVPDERWGSRVTAVVQPRAGQRPTLDELAEHCRSHIAAYKIPRELHLVEQIRRSPSGKPDYPWAQEAALSGRYRV